MSTTSEGDGSSSDATVPMDVDLNTAPSENATQSPDIEFSDLEEEEEGASPVVINGNDVNGLNPERDSCWSGDDEDEGDKRTSSPNKHAKRTSREEAHCPSVDSDGRPVDEVTGLPLSVANGHSEDMLLGSEEGATRRRTSRRRSSRKTKKRNPLDSDNDSEGSWESLTASSDDDDALQPIKAKPKSASSVFGELTHRQFGISNNYSTHLFRLRTYGSLHMVKRLELMYKMTRHEGCVNSLHFNTSGTLLVSGSDDLRCVLWDWTFGEHVLAYNSGHRSIVLQARFLPMRGDNHIVTCGRDGQVRLGELSESRCIGTRKLACHRGSAHRMALKWDSPQVVLSCGEDGVVFEIDLREPKPEKLLICQENESKVPLYTIFAHPLNPHEFAVGGRDQFIRIYDKRRIRADEGHVKKFCPLHLVNSDIQTCITCLVYNHNGSEILASYNDEDIYSFDTRQVGGGKFTHHYQGHRNNATVKGVNYFGPRGEFIVSGSDCGHIYMWDRESETVVQFMRGDEGGVVNALEPHPHMPVLATSGLDSDIKIWVPSCEKSRRLSGLRSTMRTNKKERDEYRKREPETIDGQVLWILMHNLRRSTRRRAREEGRRVVESSTDSDSEEEESKSSQTLQCRPS